MQAVNAPELGKAEVAGHEVADQVELGAHSEAECHGGKHGGRFGGKFGGRFFEKMDSNADGSVDQQEFNQLIEKRFARMDENGDKVLSGAELEHKFRKHKRGADAAQGTRTGAAGAAPNAR